MSNICRNTQAQAIIDTCKMTASIQDKTEAEMRTWPRNEKFRCYITRNGKRTSFNFFQSQAERANRPHISIVLYCVAQDTIGFMDNGFEQWCGEFGYDTDSRTAHRIYTACGKNATKLKRLFTEDEICTLTAMENEED